MIDEICCPKCGEELELIDTEFYPKYKISHILKCPECDTEYEYGISLNDNNVPDGEEWLEEL